MSIRAELWRIVSKVVMLDKLEAKGVEGSFNGGDRAASQESSRLVLFGSKSHPWGGGE